MNSPIRSRSLRIVTAGAALALAAFTPAASADVIEFSWNLTGDSAPTVHQRTFTSVQNNPSSLLTARAYATSKTDGTGDIVARNLGLYSGGLGVSGGTDSTTSPNHSLDNVGANDLILFGVYGHDTAVFGYFGKDGPQMTVRHTDRVEGREDFETPNSLLNRLTDLPYSLGCNLAS